MDCILYLEIYANKTKWGMNRLLNISLTKYITLLFFLSWIHCNEKRLRPWCASRGVCPAWCTSSCEWGSAGDGTWWYVPPPVVSGGPGREEEQEEPLPQAGTTSPPPSELGWETFREPQACSGVPGGMKDSLLAAFSLLE